MKPTRGQGVIARWWVDACQRRWQQCDWSAGVASNSTGFWKEKNCLEVGEIEGIYLSPGLLWKAIATAL